MLWPPDARGTLGRDKSKKSCLQIMPGHHPGDPSALNP